jgi:hypothetical protein
VRNLKKKKGRRWLWLLLLALLLAGIPSCNSQRRNAREPPGQELTTEVSPQRAVSIKKTREQLAKEYGLVSPTPPPFKKLTRPIVTKIEPPQSDEAADIGGFLLILSMFMLNLLTYGAFPAPTI